MIIEFVSIDKIKTKYKIAKVSYFKLFSFRKMVDNDTVIPSIVIDKEDYVVDGEIVFEAYKALGYKKILVGRKS